MSQIGIDARKLGDYGIGSYLQGLLRQLAELDPPGGIALFLSREGQDLLSELPESWRIIEVDAPGYSIREQFVVLAAALRANVKLLHVPHYVIPVLYPRRMIVTVHDIIHVLFPEFHRNTLAFSYARWAIRLAVKRAQRIITVSNSTSADLKRLFGASNEQLHVIYPGLSEIYLQPGDPRQDAVLRSKLGVPDRYLLHIGNHKPHKNAEGLLKAYQVLLLGERISPPPLFLVGGFKPQGELAQKAAAMGLGDRVRCLGYLEQAELAALYRGAAAFIYPTLYEGFGLPVLEAMACGAPVVAGDVAAVKEVAGDAVLRVNPRDVVEMAAAMRRVLEHRELVLQMKEKGRARAQAFGWREAGKATLALYQAVLKE